MNEVDDILFPAFCELHTNEDEAICKKCTEMAKLNISPEQLGIKPDFSVPLPAAVSSNIGLKRRGSLGNDSNIHQDVI